MVSNYFINEILENIDNTVTEANTLVTESIIQNISKDTMIIQESDVKTKQSFGSKIINGLKKLFGLIINGLKNLVNRIKSIFIKDKNKNLNTIALAVVGNVSDDNEDSVVEESYVMEAKQGVDYLEQHNTTPKELGNELYCEFIKDDVIRIYTGRKEHVMNNKNQSNITNKNMKNVNNNNRLFDDNNCSTAYSFCLILTKYRKQYFEMLKNYEKLFNMIQVNNDTNSESDKLFDKIIKDPFTNDLATDLNDFYFKEKGKTQHHFDINISDIISLQEYISKLGELFDKQISSPNTELSDKAIEFLNTLSKNFFNIQMSLNAFTNAITITRGYIAPKYHNKIKTPEKMAEFVNKLIEQGIPSKYVSYNVWLIANQTLKGNNKYYDPKKGQTRIVLFPKDKNIVYKVALSGFGRSANKNEEIVTKIIRDDDISKYFSLIKDSYGDHAVVKQERFINNEIKPDDQTKNMETMSSKIREDMHTIAYQIADKFNELQQSKDIKNNVSIEDLHAANFGFDTNRNNVVLFDYGMLTPSSIVKKRQAMFDELLNTGISSDSSNSSDSSDSSNSLSSSDSSSSSN